MTRKLLLLGLVSLSIGIGFYRNGWAADGGLDPTFGAGGLVITDFATGSGFASGDDVRALAVQSDGKIVAIGNAAGTFGLARYNPDGSLDAAFGTGGKVMTRVFSSFHEAWSGALQADGKIVVVGRVFTENGLEVMGLARYNPDGSLDTAFGVQGAAMADFNLRGGFAYSVAIQADGKIVIAGNSMLNFALARFTIDGRLEATFGAGGMVETDFGGGDTVRSLLIQPDGKILAGGVTTGLTLTDIALARYNPDGSLDTTFGAGGKVTTDFFGDHENLTSMALQADGKIVAAGSVNRDVRQADFAIVRYNRNGRLDESFGKRGKVFTDFFSAVDGPFSSADAAAAVTLLGNGKIIAAGAAKRGQRDPSFALARYHPDGSLDRAFGAGGKVVIGFSGIFEEARALAIQADGNIVAAGQTVSFTGNTGADFALARFEGGNPRISGASVNGKKLLVTGQRFSPGAVILLDGIEQQTVNDDANPTSLLIGKKSGKRIEPNSTVTLQVRNSDGLLSPEFRFTRPPE